MNNDDPEKPFIMVAGNIPTYSMLLRQHAATVALPYGQWGWGVDLLREAEKQKDITDVERSQVFSDLGVFLDRLGYYKESIEAFEKAIALRDRPLYWMNLALTDDHDPGTDASRMAQLRRGLRKSIGYRKPLPEMELREMPAKINIGYVSGDFRNHSAASCAFTMMECFDRERFNLFLFSSIPAQMHDTTTAQFVKIAETSGGFYTLPQGDEAAAQFIRSKNIHVLVDLSGVSGFNRLTMFCHRPAPVQVTAWGYATSTGLPEMDYFMACPVSVPDAELPHYVEDVWRISKSTHFHFSELEGRWPQIKRTETPPAFGFLGRAAKTSDYVLRTWAQILHRCPEAMLLLKDTAYDSKFGLRRIAQVMKEEGIDSEKRVAVRGMTSRSDHVASYNFLDVALDSFPENGGVTTMESLYMGVPVVTMSGPTPGSRGGRLTMNYLGLSEWIAKDRDEYIEKAVAAMQNREKHNRHLFSDRVRSKQYNGQIEYLREMEGHFTKMLELRVAGKLPNWMSKLEMAA